MSILKNLKIVSPKLNGSKIVLVAKNQPVRSINQAIFLGINDIAEFSIVEAKAKKPLVKGNCKWHLIGKLQSYKVSGAVKFFDLIQSVDSLKLAKKIDLASKKKNKVMAVLLQVNLSGSSGKGGFVKEELFSSLRELSGFRNIKVLGLMASNSDSNKERVRIYFKQAKLLFEEIKQLKVPNIEMKYLSCGFSNNFEVAVSQGVNMVCLKNTIFGDDIYEN